MEGTSQQKLKFMRTSICTEEKSQGYQQQALSSKLKEILSSLMVEKNIIDTRLISERLFFKQQLEVKQNIISTIKQQNQELKQEIQHLGSELRQSKASIQYLIKKNNKIQIQRDSLASIIHYLEHKTKQLNDQIYEMKISNQNKKQLLSNKKLSAPFLPSFAKKFDKQSLLSYTHLVDQDLLPLNIHKTQSCEITQNTLKNIERQSERLTIQKICSHPPQRLRSFGQVNKTCRQNPCKFSTVRKRASVSRADVDNIIKGSKNQQKTKRQQKKRIVVSKKNIKRYESC